jgi:hypothetical protein
MQEPVQKSGAGMGGRSADPAHECRGLRQLQAIEIAEGALLADIALVFHLLIRYLPVGGTLLALLIPVVFAVIVLRRGLYVGCMSLCVTLCLCGIVLGPGSLPLLLLEAGAGLFLGMAMRHRLKHWLTIIAGILCGSLAFWLMLLFLVSLLGGPQFFLRVIRQTYAALTPLVGLLCRLVGLGTFWEQSLFPLLNSWMQWGLQHWPVLLLLVAASLCVPLVITVYLIVTMFVRLLGYQVRPFPGSGLSGLLYRLIPRRAYTRLPLLRALRRWMRLLHMAHLRQQRAEKEARPRL